jgi:hypothetical protein
VSSIRSEIAEFQRYKQQQTAEARQLAALQIVCGIDLNEALAAAPEERRRIISKLMRRLRRERQRGLARHWSYDLNRHIALKQVLDRLCMRGDGNEKGGRAAAFGSHTAAGSAGCCFSATCACVPDPSSSRAANGRPRNSARPSDSSDRGPTSRGTPRASARSGS